MQKPDVDFIEQLNQLKMFVVDLLDAKLEFFIKIKKFFGHG